MRDTSTITNQQSKEKNGNFMRSYIEFIYILDQFTTTETKTTFSTNHIDQTFTSPTTSIRISSGTSLRLFC